MKNILLTSLGGPLALEFVRDFQSRGDFRVFISDSNPMARARAVTKDFCVLPSGHSPDYQQSLLKVCQEHDIQMVIPGSDEEACSIMRARDLFDSADIVTAVQDAALVDVFYSKSAMYDHLKVCGVKVPFYYRFSSKSEFEKGLEMAGYPQKPLLIKPDSGRGGRGVYLLSEKNETNKDGLMLINKDHFQRLWDEDAVFIMMDYFDGVTYDVDVLTYHDGTHFLGFRKRFHNVSKFFWGNEFEDNDSVKQFAQSLYKAFPTKFLLDYDFLVTDEKEIVLLEINPRPSGSTISYLPFGVNLYYVLAQSYLNKQIIEIPERYLGKKSHVFYQMIKE